MLTFSEYFSSVSYTGHSPSQCDQDLPWQGYIYLARHTENAQNTYVKFGYVMNKERLKVRETELKRTNWLYIDHVWSVINAPYVESQIKYHLSNFTNKKRISLPGKSEYVFHLPYDALKKFIQLFITTFYIQNNYVTQVPQRLKDSFRGWFSGLFYITVIYNNTRYTHNERLLSQAVEKDVPNAPVIVAWGKDNDHPEWENRLFVGRLAGPNRKAAKKTRVVVWDDNAFDRTDNVPLEWIYVSDNRQFQGNDRVLNLDTAYAFINNVNNPNKRDNNNNEVMLSKPLVF